MSAKEWRLHCQIPHTETSSYLRTSRATFIFDALRRTGWLGRVDSNLCISKSDLLNFIPPQRGLGVDRARPLIRDAQVRVPPPG
jgi:hypothetical protein